MWIRAAFCLAPFFCACTVLHNMYSTVSYHMVHVYFQVGDVNFSRDCKQYSTVHTVCTTVTYTVVDYVRTPHTDDGTQHDSLRTGCTVGLL
jgi:hypothetical protein